MSRINMEYCDQMDGLFDFELSSEKPLETIHNPNLTDAMNQTLDNILMMLLEG